MKKIEERIGVIAETIEFKKRYFDEWLTVAQNLLGSMNYHKAQIEKGNDNLGWHSSEVKACEKVLESVVSIIEDELQVIDETTIGSTGELLGVEI